MLISNRLISLREGSNLKQYELANALGVDRKTIWRAETERFVPKTELLMMYARYFDISLDYLTGLIDTPVKLSDNKKRHS